MKKSFPLLVVLALLFGSFASFAQGEIKFDMESHDFGKVPEGTIATYEFKFKNTGNQPVVLSNVQASCGCTTPEWTKEPVMPGKTGIIKAAYNSNGRPGVFNKTITVTSNAVTASKVLTIKGDVVDKSKASYTPEQKAKSPKVTIAQPVHNFGKLEISRSVSTKVKVKNTGKTDLVISSVKAACNCVYLTHTPEPIKPNQETTLELSYTPSVLADRTEVVEIQSNDIVTENAKITLKANVVQNLAPTSIVKEGKTSVPFK